MNVSLIAADALVFGARDWFYTAIILSAVVAVLAIWSYVVRSHLSGLRFLTMLLKVVAVAALAFCLVEPMRYWLN